MDRAARVVGYVRVSTSEQGHSGLGISAQEAAIRTAVEQHGWTLVEIITDKASSGKNLDRPGLARALDLIATGKAGGLVAAKLDRISRSVIDFATLVEWFLRAGAALVAIDVGVDTSTPGGKLVANVFASVAEWERETIAARTKDGLAALRARGRPISRPAVSDNPELAERIRALRQAGASYQAIADTLNAEGVPTLRGAAAWRVSSVQAAAGYRRPPARKRTAELPRINRRRRAS